MTVTFGGVELKNIEPFNIAPGIIANTVVLVNAKVSIQATSATSFRREYRCHTDTYGDISALFALIGSPTTLYEDGQTYENCFITEFPVIQANPQLTEYEYTVIIEQDTSL